MRIVGIEPALPKPHYLSSLHLVRVGLPSLLTHLRNTGHDVKLFMEEITLDEEELRKEVRKADLIAISTLSATNPRGISLAQLVREETKSPIVIGGPHVSFCGREETAKMLETINYAVRFEGEISLPMLVETIEGKRNLEEVPNLSYLDAKGKLMENPIYAGPLDLNEFPYPDFSLINGWKQSFIMPIETSRGCPFDCTFCCVHEMFPNRRFRDPESVVNEIKRINPRSVFFCDDNFAINMQRSKEILSIMLEKLDRVPPWGAQVRVSVAKDEDWLRLAKRTNCQFLCSGFESINPSSLKEMQKKQTLEEIEGYLSILRDKKMLKVFHGSFAIGFDSDDKNTALKTAEWARKQGLSSIQMWVLAPLPGTALRASLEKQGRLISYDPRNLDGTRATFVPANMTPADLQQSVFTGMKRFYSLSSRLSAAARGIGGITHDYWSQLFKADLWRNNFREMVAKWYGRSIVEKIEKRAKEYLNNKTQG